MVEAIEFDFEGALVGKTVVGNAVVGLAVGVAVGVTVGISVGDNVSSYFNVLFCCVLSVVY